MHVVRELWAYHHPGTHMLQRMGLSHTKTEPAPQQIISFGSCEGRETYPARARLRLNEAEQARLDWLRSIFPGHSPR